MLKLIPVNLKHEMTQDGEYFHLNELKNYQKCTDENCKPFTNGAYFLLEADPPQLNPSADERKAHLIRSAEVLENTKHQVYQAVYSGNKSIHIIVKVKLGFYEKPLKITEFSEDEKKKGKDKIYYKNFRQKWEEHKSFQAEFLRENYKLIHEWLRWKFSPAEFGDGEYPAKKSYDDETRIFRFDKSCSNPSRLTRIPGAVNAKTGKVQKLLFNMGNCIYISLFDILWNFQRQRPFLPVSLDMVETIMPTLNEAPWASSRKNQGIGKPVESNPDNFKNFCWNYLRKHGMEYKQGQRNHCVVTLIGATKKAGFAPTAGLLIQAGFDKEIVTEAENLLRPLRAS